MSEPQSRNGTRRRRIQDPGPARPQGPPRACDWPGCTEAGEYRAPRSRERLREFFWFCLEHVRHYNRSWDFFAGMSQAEIEAYLRADVTWHRPTWRMGTRAAGPNDYRIDDAFDLLGGGPKARGHANGAAGDTVSRRTERMLARLDLEPGCTLVELKRRYKQLVKRHHPDLHGGDRAAEERLKVINEAYTYLLDSGLFT